VAVTAEQEVDQIKRSLDSLGLSALVIYDVAKVLPHPYDAVSDMANHWAHDFIGCAQHIIAVLERDLNRSNVGGDE
jgi:hypothetical protein